LRFEMTCVGRLALLNDPGDIQVDKQIKGLQPGDLVRIEWFDASVGKSLSGGLAGIDVPVKSWGIYIGLLGQKTSI